MLNYLQLISAILLPIVGGWTTSKVMVGQVRRPGGKAWYQLIRKPVWTPRNAVFAPVWIVLYTSMGTASYFVYNSAEDFEKVKVPLTLYGMQLLLNFTWTPIFFGLHWLRMAFFEMLLLDVATMACTYSFYQTSLTGALLMSPYLAWLAFASYLNFAVWRMNLEPGINKKSQVNDNAAILKPL